MFTILVNIIDFQTAQIIDIRCIPGVLQRQRTSAFYAYDTYVKELGAIPQSSNAMARKNLEILKAYNKRQCDQYVHVPKFEIGVM
jgi:hypothetical protein